MREGGKTEKRITSSIKDGRGRRINNPFNSLSCKLYLFYIGITKHRYPTFLSHVYFFLSQKEDGHVTIHVHASMCVSYYIPGACM